MNLPKLRCLFEGLAMLLNVQTSGVSKMAKYTITVSDLFADGRTENKSIITRKRSDAAEFQAHFAIYNAAKARSILDTKRAWAALNEAIVAVRNKQPCKIIDIGGQRIVIECD